MSYRGRMPRCFTDPDISSGVCNPLLPLRPDEPCECALARSCLIARLLKDDKSIPLAELKDRPYDEILTRADNVWSALQAHKQEEADRQKVRVHVASAKMAPAVNPFRIGSLRHFIVETLAKDWTALSDLLADIAMHVPDAKNVDLVLDYVTSITSQEQHGYRIMESGGLYKCFAR